MRVQLSSLIFLFISFNALHGAYGNPCAGLWFGEIVAAERCDQYYVCILTIPSRNDCAPNTVFDASVKKCVPGNPETCEIGEGTSTVQTTTTETTTPETTTPETTTPRPPVDLAVICSGVFFAAKPYPYSLEIYVGCIRGNGVLFTCMENEFFHPVINECLRWPESTSQSPGTQTVTTVTSTLPNTSSERETTTSTPEPDTTTRVTITTPLPLEGVCDGKFFDFVKHPSNCALFIFCYEQKEFLRQCPEFKIFDIVTISCQFGDQETCEFFPENTIPITEPSTTTVFVSTTTPPTTTVFVSTTTPPTTIFVSTTTPPTTTYPSTAETIEETTVFNPCVNIENGNVPNPLDCTQFYRCFNQRFAPAMCPADHIFDASRQFCVLGDRESC